MKKNENKKISASIMCADLFELKRSVNELKRAGVEYIHIDVMDGIFVKNFMLGTNYVSGLRGAGIPLDIHLMVTDPSEKLAYFDIREGDVVSTHVETSGVNFCAEYVHSKGAKYFLAINPDTPLSALDEHLGVIDGVLIMSVRPGFAGAAMAEGAFERIAALRKKLDSENIRIPIEVDGCVSFENAEKMSACGADIFVGGSKGLFRKDMTIAGCAKKLRESIG